MKITKTELDGVFLIDPPAFEDPRGWFLEAWRADPYRVVHPPGTFVQDNVSRSSRGTLRGLHAQEPYGQGKLVQVLEGEVFDVAVDIRVGSPTFGRWVGERLSSTNHRQMFIPAGFAHGFCVTSETALLMYKCTELYHPEAEFGVLWDDPEIGIAWPIRSPLLSRRDASATRLASIPASRLPKWEPDGVRAVER